MSELAQEVEALRREVQELKAKLAEEERDYEELTGLLRKRFPQNPDGSYPDWKIEDVLTENGALHAQVVEMRAERDRCRLDTEIHDGMRWYENLQRARAAGAALAEAAERYMGYHAERFYNRSELVGLWPAIGDYRKAVADLDKGGAP